MNKRRRERDKTIRQVDGSVLGEKAPVPVRSGPVWSGPGCVNSSGCREDGTGRDKTGCDETGWDGTGRGGVEGQGYRSGRRRGELMGRFGTGGGRAGLVGSGPSGGRTVRGGSATWDVCRRGTVSVRAWLGDGCGGSVVESEAEGCFWQLK